VSGEKELLEILADYKKRLMQSEKDRRDAVMLLAAIISHAGGKISLPYKHLALIDNSTTVQRYDDPANFCTVLEIERGLLP
jgi:hypothetical protein